LAVALLAAASVMPVGRAGAADANWAAVAVRDSFFSPNNLTVNVGDTLVFARAQDAKLTHTVTSDTGLFDAELNDQRQYFGLKFQQAGTYNYYCRYHGSSGMTGTIVVQ